jgi:hypothetical protein
MIRQLGLSFGWTFARLPSSLEKGFTDVSVRGRERFYGISQTHSPEEIISSEYEEALEKGMISAGYSPAFFERARRVIEEMIAKSRRDNFTLFNGPIARLVFSSFNEEKDALVLILEPSSYFTFLGESAGGYRYQLLADKYPDEEPLPDFLLWTTDPQEMINSSALSNGLSVQVMLYNNEEILYALRGNVATHKGKMTASAAGWIEIEEGSLHDLHNHTACKEAHEELGIEIGEVSWGALGAITSDCDLQLLGSSYTPLSQKKLSDLAALADDAEETEGIFGLNYSKLINDPEALALVLERDILSGISEEGYPWLANGQAALLLTLAKLCPDSFPIAAKNILGVN